jgi:hypothetical protein
MIEYLQGEVASLKKWLRSNGISAVRPWKSSQMRPRRAGRKQLNQLRGSWGGASRRPPGISERLTITGVAGYALQGWLDMPSDPIETSKLCAARSLVELVWDTPSISHTFDIEYEGATWEVVVRIKSTEEGGLADNVEDDFTEQLPE